MNPRPRLIRPIQLNEISGEVVDAAMRVHSTFGPGLLETPYRDCLAYELRTRGLIAHTEVAVPLVYGELQIDVAYRIDLLVERAVVVETKSVSKLISVHRAQTISHLRLARYRVGLLINFNVVRLRDGIERFVIDV